MTTIDQIEKAVLNLSAAELDEFRAWFASFAQTRLEAETIRQAEQIQQSIAQHDRGEGRDGFEVLEELKETIREQSGA